MYKYTPKPEIVQGLDSASRNRTDPNARWKFAKQYVSSWAEFHIFCKYFSSVQYFSKKKVTEVPVLGVLFPVHHFVCEKTKETP